MLSIYERHRRAIKFPAQGNTHGIYGQGRKDKAVRRISVCRFLTDGRMAVLCHEERRVHTMLGNGTDVHNGSRGNDKTCQGTQVK